MPEWWVNAILVGIAKLWLWLRLMRPGQQQQVMFWSRVRPPMATNAIDGHGEVMPCLCIHNRLRRLEKIVVALEWRNRQCHATNPWADTGSPGVSCINKPISFNRSL